MRTWLCLDLPLSSKSWTPRPKAHAEAEPGQETQRQWQQCKYCQQVRPGRKVWGAGLDGRTELKRKAEMRGEKLNQQGKNGKSLSTGGFGAGTRKYSIPSGCVALRAEGRRGAVSVAPPADSVPRLRCCRGKWKREICARGVGRRQAIALPIIHG